MAKTPLEKSICYTQSSKKLGLELPSLKSDIPPIDIRFYFFNTKGSLGIWPEWFKHTFWITTIFCISIVTYVTFYNEPSNEHPQASNWNRITSRQDGNSLLPSSSTLLNVFQVSIPVLGPYGIITSRKSNQSLSHPTQIEPTAYFPVCQVILMEFSFANSFGKPFIGKDITVRVIEQSELTSLLGNYTPPSCMRNANTVVMNLTVASKGLQFDRLGLMYVPFLLNRVLCFVVCLISFRLTRVISILRLMI